MTMHDFKLRGREQVAHGTTAFHFEKPAGFTFKPGQAIDVVLPRAGGDRRAKRASHLLNRQRAFRERSRCRHADARHKPIYYLASPPGMVEVMRLTLNDAGVHVDDIRSEEFYGY